VSKVNREDTSEDVEEDVKEWTEEMIQEDPEFFERLSDS
jgi:hypothetical protein